MSLAYTVIDSPVGKLKLVASDKGLVAILWENYHPSRVRLQTLVKGEAHAILLEAEQQLGVDWLAQQFDKIQLLL
jgi:methylated-DNA-[protein]-cysteine S-methyltransferase